MVPAPCAASRIATKEIQIEFWQRATKEGFTDEQARASAHKFRVAFDALDQRLAQHPYLMGDSLSVLARPEFAKEIAMPPEAVRRLEATRRSQVEAGKTLEAVAGF
jgi:hypothetical protein